MTFKPGEPIGEGNPYPTRAGGYLATIAVIPVVEATPDYAAGDVIGGKNLLAGIARADGGSGYITAVRIYSKSDVTAAIDVLFFNADPAATTWTENGPVAMNDADAAKLLGVVTVDKWTDLGTPSLGYAECRIPVTGLAADDLTMVMVARGAINLASVGDLIVAVTMDQN